MRLILALFILNLFASFTYVTEMSDLMTWVFVVINAISVASWSTLAVLMHISQRTYGKFHPEFFSWVAPVRRAFIFFCLISAARALLNDLLVWSPIFAGAQATAFVLHNTGLVVACGYASVYYRRIPRWAERLSNTLQGSH